MARARSRRGRGLAALGVIAALVVAGVYFVPGLLNRYGDRYFSDSACTATAAGESHTLTGEQTGNAAIIGSFVIRLELPTRAGVVALATAIQESGLRNVDYGDRDSLGLFQQRPSQGWGTPEQVSSPRYATRAFYEALLKVDGWESMEVTVAAQTVQRSAFPDAYADHEHEARPWAAALAGDAGIDAVTCRLPAATPSPTAVEDLQAAIRESFGRHVIGTPVSSDGKFAVVILDHRSGEYRDAIAAWAVATATQQPIEAVGWCVRSWSRATGEWVTDEDAAPRVDCDPSGVAVTLAIA